MIRILNCFLGLIKNEKINIKYIVAWLYKYDHIIHEFLFIQAEFENINFYFSSYKIITNRIKNN